MSEEQYAGYVAIYIGVLAVMLAVYHVWERHLTHIEVMAGCLQ